MAEKHQAGVWRDVFEPGWREKEKEREEHFRALFEATSEEQLEAIREIRAIRAGNQPKKDDQ